MTTRRPRPAPLPRSAFSGFRFPSDVIVVAVRWYLRFGLSYRDVEELLAERGVQVDHISIYRWVQRFTPLLAEAARPCRHAVGDRWFVDETYVRVAGRWRYVHRAVDQFGQVIDVLVAARRDAGPLTGSSSACLARPWSRPSRSSPIRRRCIRACWRSCYQRRGIEPTSTPTTASSGRVRSRPAEGAAATDAWAQAGSQHQGDHRGACVRTERSTRARRAGR